MACLVLLLLAWRTEQAAELQTLTERVQQTFYRVQSAQQAPVRKKSKKKKQRRVRPRQETASSGIKVNPEALSAEIFRTKPIKPVEYLKIGLEPKGQQRPKTAYLPPREDLRLPEDQRALRAYLSAIANAAGVSIDGLPGGDGRLLRDHGKFGSYPDFDRDE